MAYDASYNQTFYARLKNWALQYQSLREEGARLQSIWTGLAVSGDPDFAETDGITTTEATALVTMLGDFEDFTENQSVSQGDRNAVIVPFLNES